MRRPKRLPDRPAGGEPSWDTRIDELGRVDRTAVLSQVAPDGFPFSARVEVGVVRIAG